MGAAPPYKVGDVVQLRGTPDLALVVTDCTEPREGKYALVDVAWIFDGVPHEAWYPADALQLVQAHAAAVGNAQAVIDLQRALDEAMGRCVDLGGALDQLRKDHGAARGDVDAAVSAARAVYPEYDGKTASGAVQALARRYVQLRDEANATIAELRAQLPA